MHPQVRVTPEWAAPSLVPSPFREGTRVVLESCHRSFRCTRSQQLQSAAILTLFAARLDLFILAPTSLLEQVPCEGTLSASNLLRDCSLPGVVQIDRDPTEVISGNNDDTPSPRQDERTRRGPAGATGRGRPHPDALRAGAGENSADGVKRARFVPRRCAEQSVCNVLVQLRRSST